MKNSKNTRFCPAYPSRIAARLLAMPRIAISRGHRGTATLLLIVLAGIACPPASADNGVPPVLNKSWTPNHALPGGIVQIRFDIGNPGTAAALTGVAFDDVLPAGLSVGNIGATAIGCGIVSAVAPSTIHFTNGTIPANTPSVNSGCNFEINITTSAAGVFTNTTTAITSNEGGSGSASSAVLTVGSAPTISKSFGAATVAVGANVSLTFTLANPNAGVDALGVGFNDSLPSGLVVATPNGLSNTCGGTATATAGTGSVQLSGASLAAGGSCTVSLSVTGTSAGTKNNSVQVTTTNLGNGNTSNTSLRVLAPPTLSKVFGAATVPLNGSTSLTFTVSNPNATDALTGIAFSDALPSGLVVATPNGQTGTCLTAAGAVTNAAALTATAGSGSISISGLGLAASGSCTFAVNVTGTSAGTQTNTTGSISSTNGGTGGTASASLGVVAPPTITKSFNPTATAVGGTSSLTFTVTNPVANAVALTGVAFSDTLPTGLTVPNASAAVCGGNVTLTNPTGIQMTGATIGVGSQCLFSVTVTGAVGGQYTNTTGNVTSANGGTGLAATADLTVGSPPTIAKSFGAATAGLNQSVSLTFNISNPNAGVALSGIGFNDSLPSGMIVSTPNGVTNTCGGTVTAVAGSGSVQLSGGSLPPGSSCSVVANVTATTAGAKNNSVQVTTTNLGNGNTSNASITMLLPPAVSSSFGAASVTLGESTSLTFTISNPNGATAINGIALTSTLAPGLVVSTPNGQTGTCLTTGGSVTTAGSLTAAAGSGSINLSGLALGPSGSCTFAVNVTGMAPGVLTNTTDNVTSTNAGTGNSTSASLSVVSLSALASIPSLTGWGMAILELALASIVVLGAVRRR